MKIAINILLTLIVYAFGGMLLSSYTHHSTIGIDADRIHADDTVTRTYARLWWPGNGSLLLGYSAQHQPFDPNTTYERFDPAGTFFQPKRHKLTPQSRWNDHGFWWISQPAPAPQFWVGIPAWLPVFFFVLVILRRQKPKQ